MRYYTSLVLDKGSRTSLLKAFKDVVPNWRDYPKLDADHMTIDYVSDSPSKYDGEKRSIKIKGLGIDDKHVAVSVSDGGLSGNGKPHVTIALGSGGSASNSNRLKFDENFPSLTLTGKVESIPQTREKYSNIGGPNKSEALELLIIAREMVGGSILALSLSVGKSVMTHNGIGKIVEVENAGGRTMRYGVKLRRNPFDYHVAYYFPDELGR
jgi:hypothetical protein